MHYSSLVRTKPIYYRPKRDAAGYTSEHKLVKIKLREKNNNHRKKMSFEDVKENTNYIPIYNDTLHVVVSILRGSIYI